MPGLADYRDALIARFGNPTLRHSVHQIATDGSKKIGDRWVPSIQAQLGLGHTIENHAMIVAAWIWSCRGLSDQGQPYSVNDPHGEMLQGLALQYQNSPTALMDAFLKLDFIWSPQLSNDVKWRSVVARWLEIIATQGTGSALALLVSTPATPTSQTHGEQFKAA